MKVDLANRKLYSRRDVKEAEKELRFAYDIAEMVVVARLKRGLTQQQLAEKMGTRQPSIARIERAEYVPSIPFLRRMAKALGTTLIAPKFELCVDVEFEYADAQTDNTVGTTTNWDKIMIGAFNLYSGTEDSVSEDSYQSSCRALTFGGI